MDAPRDDRFLPPPSAPQRRKRFRIPEHPLFHLALLAATFVTTTLAGGLEFTETHGLFGKGSFSDGYPFSIPLLLILGCHEMGHYLMCRHYGIAATLPYFIPSPLIGLIGEVSPGTFGAIIRIKEPIRRKQHLVDVGAAGPLAGFVVSIPFLLYGVTKAQPIPPTTGSEGVLFDYPFAVRLAQKLMGSGLYTSATVREDPTFIAAWFGLLVTALNLLPIGQLDGGHILRAAAGRRQPMISAAVLLLLALTAFQSPIWVMFGGIVAVFIGVRHPPVENDDEPLDFTRQLVALLCLGVFLLCFALAPLKRPS
jgi:membrane-associated protease RseP (regulator of RpoE activity)